MPEKKKRDIDAQLKRIGDLLAEPMRDDYESLLDRLQEARTQFQTLLAERFTDPFNSQLASTDHQTLSQKQSVTHNANADLRRLGLAIKCPRTGHPAILHADRGRAESNGRFQISLNSNKLNRRKTFSSQEIFPVTLMANPIRKEGMAEYWSQRIQSPENETHEQSDPKNSRKR